MPKNPPPYDSTSASSIVEYASRLQGHTLRQLLPAGAMGLEMGKGSFGNSLQQYYFGQPPNSRSEPDFAEAGVELKTSPVVRRKERWVVKERLVLNMLDYRAVGDETWEYSTFLKKNARILLVFYHWEPEKGLLDQQILRVHLWSVPSQDLPTVRHDWETITAKVRNGRAHEISEGDTLYLAACTKGSSGDVRRKQRFSTELAKPRALSFKASYMQYVLEQLLGHGPALESITAMATVPPLEESVRSRFQPYRSMTAMEIAARLGLKQDLGAKNFHAAITKAILGVSPDKGIAEFVKGGIIQRTIRVGRGGRPEEDVSFPAFKYMDLIEQEWEHSDLREQLTTRFFFVIYEADADGRYLLADTVFWTMPVKDLEDHAHKVWNETVKRVKAGRADDLPKKSDDSVCHVRPHGRDAADTIPAPGGKVVVRKSFWLAAGYIKQQLLDRH